MSAKPEPEDMRSMYALLVADHVDNKSEMLIEWLRLKGYSAERFALDDAIKPKFVEFLADTVVDRLPDVFPLEKECPHRDTARGADSSCCVLHGCQPQGLSELVARCTGNPKRSIGRGDGMPTSGSWREVDIYSGDIISQPAERCGEASV